MKLRRPPRSTHSETIITLIDVVFFLLVFFMLIGRMDATAPFEVTPPTAFTGADMPAGGATVSVAANGALALDGTLIDGAEIDAALTRQIAQNPQLLIRINASRDAELRHVLPLVQRFERLGAQDVALVVSPESPGGGP